MAIRSSVNRRFIDMTPTLKGNLPNCQIHDSGPARLGRALARSSSFLGDRLSLSEGRGGLSPPPRLFLPLPRARSLVLREPKATRATTKRQRRMSLDCRFDVARVSLALSL